MLGSGPSLCVRACLYVAFDRSGEEGAIHQSADCSPAQGLQSPNKPLFGVHQDIHTHTTPMRNKVRPIHTDIHIRKQIHKITRLVNWWRLLVAIPLLSLFDFCLILYRKGFIHVTSTQTQVSSQANVVVQVENKQNPFTAK